MDAKEKAIEIVEKFTKLTEYTDCYSETVECDIYFARQCAYLCVDEIIKVLRKKDNALTYLEKEIRYFESVKAHIEEM